jgi:hypothetical protein
VSFVTACYASLWLAQAGTAENIPPLFLVKMQFAEKSATLWCTVKAPGVGFSMTIALTPTGI